VPHTEPFAVPIAVHRTGVPVQCRAYPRFSDRDCNRQLGQSRPSRTRRFEQLTLGDSRAPVSLASGRAGHWLVPLQQSSTSRVVASFAGIPDALVGHGPPQVRCLSSIKPSLQPGLHPAQNKQFYHMAGLNGPGLPASRRQRRARSRRPVDRSGCPPCRSRNGRNAPATESWAASPGRPLFAPVRGSASCRMSPITPPQGGKTAHQQDAATMLRLGPSIPNPLSFPSGPGCAASGTPAQKELLDRRQLLALGAALDGLAADAVVRLGHPGRAGAAWTCLSTCSARGGRLKVRLPRRTAILLLEPGRTCWRSPGRSATPARLLRSRPDRGGAPLVSFFFFWAELRQQALTTPTTTSGVAPRARITELLRPGPERLCQCRKSGFPRDAYHRNASAGGARSAPAVQPGAAWGSDLLRPTQRCTHVGLYLGKGRYPARSGAEHGHNGLACGSSLPATVGFRLASHYRKRTARTGRVVRLPMTGTTFLSRRLEAKAAP